MRFFILTLISLQIAQAKNCLFTPDTSKTKLTWTAYKTPEKVGVDGSFDSISYKFSNKANSIEKLITGTNFSIATESTNSGNPARDKKLVDFFFNELIGNKLIKGSFKSIDKKKKMAVAQTTFNGVTKKINLNYKFENDILELNGKIDVLDFALGKQLEAINKACFDLHKGKTWSEVNLLIQVPVSTVCN